jgi:hypothetical protein
MKQARPRSSTNGDDNTRYWVAVVPKEPVMRAVAGGFAMFAHGRHTAIKRTGAGDWIAYYSPRTLLKAGDEVRAFTAIGRFTDREPYETEMMAGRVGWRRDVTWQKKALAADIYPLLDQLSFVRDREHWGLFFHRSLFSIPRDDFAVIAEAMGLDLQRV